MLFTLPDGRIIDLECVSTVSTIRDYGSDPRSIDRHILGFSIYLKKKREVVEVLDTYHFNDWAEARLRLKKTREEIVNRLPETATAN
jgi:hypothetical protein